MIITCPDCSTRYKLADDKFPAEGRRVRCAKCGTVWHQESAEPAAPPVTAAPVSDDTSGTSEAADTQIEQSEPDAPEKADAPTPTPKLEIPDDPPPPPPPPPPAEPVPDPAPVTPAVEVTESEPAPATEEEREPDAKPLEESAAAAPITTAKEPLRRPSVNVENEVPKEAPSPLPAMRDSSGTGNGRIFLLAIIVVVLILAGLAFVFRDQIAGLIGSDETNVTRQASLTEQPDDISSDEPQSVPEPIEQNPLQLRVVDSKIDEVKGYRVLLIRGEITNPTADSHVVPEVTVDLLDRLDQTLRQWTFTVPFATIDGGATQAFSEQLPNPPLELDRLRFGFSDAPTREGGS